MLEVSGLNGACGLPVSIQDTLLLLLLSIRAVVIQAEGPYEVTLVNRQYHKGRSMLNTAAVITSMKAMEQVSTVK